MATAAAVPKKVQFQDVSDDDDASSVSSIAPVDQSSFGAANKQPANMVHVATRNEKKARKILAKLPLVPVPTVTRVTMRRGRIIFAIDNPEVFRLEGTDQYVVYGEAKVQDPMWHAQAAMAQQQAAAHHARIRTQQGGADDGKEESEKDPVQESDSEAVDGSGLDEKDVQMVMEQANVKRGTAVKALRKNGNDIVNAIMELTM